MTARRVNTRAKSAARAMEDSSTSKPDRAKAHRPAASKNIRDMFSSVAAPLEPMKQLETTLNGHTAMFEKILTAIRESKEVLEAKIGTLQEETGLLRADHTKLSERVTETESCLSSLRPTVVEVQQHVKEMRAEMHRLRDRAEDAEGRSRRNNVRFLGFPEKSESPNAELFLEEWLLKEVLRPPVPKFFSIERAHRIPGKPPIPGAFPRPLIARLLNFRDRDLILQIFRTKGPIQFNGQRITAYPDFTAEVQRKRSSYAAIKASLRDAGLRYALLFPAKLRVVDGEKVRFFHSAADAGQWLDERNAGTSTHDKAADEQEWSTRKPHKRKVRRPRGRPTPEQATSERSKVVAELLTQTSNRYAGLVLDSDSETPGGSDGASLASSPRRGTQRMQTMLTE